MKSNARNVILRGERAAHYCWFLTVKSRSTPTLEMMAKAGDRAAVVQKFPNVLLAFSKLVAIAKKEYPLHLQARQSKRLQLQMPKREFYLSLVLDNGLKAFRASQYSQSGLRTAIAGMALARYRGRHSKWPPNLDFVVDGKLISAVPIDPYHDSPLSYRKTSNGMVVFSTGEEARFSGNCREHGRQTNNEMAVHLEFRLWDHNR